MQADLMKDSQVETQKDVQLQAVSNLAKNCWPKARADVLETARAFHTFCESLTLRSGLIYVQG